MLFISGVHGVGKSYFCTKVKADLGITTFSASQLISERKHAGFSSDKLIPDIDINQQYLLLAVPAHVAHHGTIYMFKQP